MPVKITYTEDQKYGLPEQKKYPMPDKRHVISAIKFFNYVEPKYEKQLAKAILARIEEYGMSLDDIGVGEDNRFSKYIPDQHLAHHGILGQKWGKRMGPPYPLDSSEHSSSEKKAGWRESLNNQTENNGISKSHKNEEPINAIGLEYKNDTEFKQSLLRKNPNAAVLNPNLGDWVKKNKNKIIAGAAAIGAAGLIAAGTAYYLKNRNTELSKFLASTQKLSEVKVELIDKTPVDSLLQNESSSPSADSELFVKAWLKSDMHRFDPISESEFASMTNDDAVDLDAGHALYRLSQSHHDSLRSGFEYVSCTDEDRKRYLGFLPRMWSVNNPSGHKLDEVFEMELSSKVAIRAPGKKESIEIMMAALKKAYPGHTDEVYRKDVLQNFYRYNLNLADRSYYFGAWYAKELRSRGYNAVIDFNDAGRLSDRPLILLNGSKSASVKKVNSYSSSVFEKAFDVIKLPEVLKNFTLDDWAGESKNVMFSLYEQSVKKYLKVA